ncbi:hypothetical protein C8E03_101332 [Lachnotalea glycerini]|uniref:Uncharacterized protein n=1 Tax=Lachnotalea glycerini TaxID=1763509 RepID=A0A318ETX3_9FIRM|nr:hypothetical protein [Lachnotalea glycerini]PXV95702.1 hypothetical protein C8E03_101332 [Lachnotalea glycerini]
MDLEKKVFILEEYFNEEREINLNQYTHIRAYHACRPLSVQDYFAKGIEPISCERALEEALIRLKSEGLNKDKIKGQFKIAWKDLNEIHKKVWLIIHKELLLTKSGHYLIYGSEFLNALAMELGYRDSLKQVGIPTIFHCDIPIKNLACSEISYIEEGIELGREFGYDISISVDTVPPQYIVDYEHPNRKIPDPYYYGVKYKPDYKELKNLGI